MKKVAIVLCLSVIAALFIVGRGHLTGQYSISACNPDELPIYLIGPGYLQPTPSTPSNDYCDVAEREHIPFGVLKTVVKSAIGLYQQTQGSY